LICPYVFFPSSLDPFSASCDGVSVLALRPFCTPVDPPFRGHPHPIPASAAHVPCGPLPGWSQNWFFFNAITPCPIYTSRGCSVFSARSPVSAFCGGVCYPSPSRRPPACLLRTRWRVLRPSLPRAPPTFSHQRSFLSPVNVLLFATFAAISLSQVSETLLTLSFSLVAVYIDDALVLGNLFPFRTLWVSPLTVFSIGPSRAVVFPS